jgi:predicted ATP-dependent endonuclease of OLD family
VIKLKRIILKNFCGYKNFQWDFTNKETGKINNLLMLYGPNGIGKSSFLDAIRLLSNPRKLANRQGLTTFFRKLTFNQNYVPGLDGFDGNKEELYMEGVFDTSEGEKRVILKNNWIDKESGLILNELGYSENSIYLDSDHPNQVYSFQLRRENKEKFLDFASSIYGFKCEMPQDYKDLDYSSENISFCNDFIIIKPPYGVKVHYKRMSAGEKKIATMLRILFDDCYSDKNLGILLIDNIELHLYFRRHLILLQKLNEYFGDRQIIATTHSPVIIDNLPKESLCDLEEYFNDEKK